MEHVPKYRDKNSWKAWRLWSAISLRPQRLLHGRRTIFPLGFPISVVVVTAAEEAFNAGARDGVVRLHCTGYPAEGRSQDLPDGRNRGSCAARSLDGRQAWRVCRGYGSVGFRQIDDDEHHRMSGPAQRRK